MMGNEMEKDLTQKLVERVRQGEREAFDRLYELKMKGILYLCVRLLDGNVHDGEDAAQRVILAVYNKIGMLKDPKLFDRWLYRIAWNTCMDLRRKKARLKEDVAQEERLEMIEEERIEFIPHEYYVDKDRRE